MTGASRGIGRACAIKLAQMGYHILLNYRSNDAEAEATQKQIEDNGGTAELLKYDVNNEADVNATLTAWQEAHPGEYISVLVNNAGIRQDNLLVWMTNEEWNNVLGTTLNGFMFTTRALMQKMLVKKWGRIINMASLSGLKGLPGQANYSAAKGGLIAATKAIAQEVARKNVTVNAVAPGFIATDMTKDLNEKELKTTIPANRFGTPEEVAAVVGFLASKDASYITGQVISVNGGLYS